MTENDEAISDNICSAEATEVSDTVTTAHASTKSEQSFATIARLYRQKINDSTFRRRKGYSRVDEVILRTTVAHLLARTSRKAVAAFLGWALAKCSPCKHQYYKAQPRSDNHALKEKIAA